MKVKQLFNHGIFLVNKITRKDLFTIFPFDLVATPNIIAIEDKEFTLPTDKQVVEHMRDFKCPEYIPETQDCDNAAIACLMHFMGRGYAFAYIKVTGHAKNLYINNNKIIKELDPRTKKISYLKHKILDLLMV